MTMYLIIIMLSFAFSKDWNPIKQSNSKTAIVTLQNSDIKSSVLTFETLGFWTKKVETKFGSSLIIETESGTPILEQKSPDLEKLTASIIIPDSDNMNINILSSEYIDYYNIQVAPSKGNLLRNINPDQIPYEYGNIYTVDEFYPGKLAELRDPYILRDVRGQTVVVYPFQYNPIKNKHICN